MNNIKRTKGRLIQTTKYNADEYDHVGGKKILIHQKGKLKQVRHLPYAPNQFKNNL